MIIQLTPASGAHNRGDVLPIKDLEARILPKGKYTPNSKQTTAVKNN